MEAWWDRNSAIGAWVYSIPPDASPATVDWDRYVSLAPKRPYEAERFFRWRNYQDYGTGVAGDLFVHLFSGMHFVTGAIGPKRIFASGGAALLERRPPRRARHPAGGSTTTDKTQAHPAFNLALRVNFVNGAGETSGFQFTGSQGVMTIGNGVTLSKLPPERDPGTSGGNFDEATRKLIQAEHDQRYPRQSQTAASMEPLGEEHWLPPRGYSDHLDHHLNFFAAVRSRQPVVEDATFGLRAAAPALLSNESYYTGKTLAWDPAAMEVKG